MHLLPPVPMLVLPLGQAVHNEAPCAALYVPWAQGLQAAEALEAANVPAGHLLQPLAPLSLYSPAGHAWQVAMVPPVENLPAGHASQLLEEGEPTP